MHVPPSEDYSPEPAGVVAVAGLIDQARDMWHKQALAESEVLLRKTLELAEASLGPEDPYLAVT